MGKGTTEEYLARLSATMEDLSESTATFQAMIYGNSGTGKTVMSMQIAQEITPVGKNILYIDTASGWVSLNNHRELKERTKRMKYINLAQLEALCTAIRTEHPPFNTLGSVIVDEASSIADTTLDEIVKYRASQDRAKDEDMPTQPDYGAATNRVRKAFMDLLTLPGIHVILVAHARKDKDNQNIEVTSPSFMPKLSQKIKQPLHLVAHLSGNDIPGTEGKESQYVRILQVHPTRRIDAKTRIGGLSPQVEYPTFITKLKLWLEGEIKTVEVTQLVPDFDPEVPNPVTTIEGE